VRLVLAHTRATTLDLARYPSFLLPTLGLPPLFFLFFAAPRAGAGDADLYLASYAGFAVLAVAFFQFGVGIAAERARPWEAYLRTLPLRPATRLAARLLAAAAFAGAGAALVAAAALAATDARPTAGEWARLALALGVGGAAFGVLGIALGYSFRPRSAIPLANLLYLALAYMGGLWGPPSRLPPAIAAVSPYLPTRPFGDVLRAGVRGEAWLPRAWLVLAAWTVGFGVFALWAYRRDEGERFG
jgi:ABC-2 type transport system permease protein